MNGIPGQLLLWQYSLQIIHTKKLSIEEVKIKMKEENVVFNDVMYLKHYL